MLIAQAARGICMDDVWAKLRPKPMSAPPPMPMTINGLLRALRDSPPDWAATAATDLARAFGTPKDHRLWPCFVQVAEDVRCGALSSDDVIDCLREALKPVDSRGRSIKNHGAYFCKALKSRGYEPRPLKAEASR